uniref:chaperone protein dnaJ 11, chloroplastic-like n=1 Tax=Erigeron canadensis TaxID=72917 RepID=UPI001CB979A0|nr:chaperone protein dnaJ 11, chloroplastic-like [Erigeron canadensis]
MAFSISTSFLSPNFTFNSKSSSQYSNSSNYVHYKKSPISATFATKDRTTSEEANTNKSFRNTCSSSLYEVLGVRIGADTKEVKAAYRRLARVLHPDVTTSNDSSADEFMKIHSAYTTLTDPEKRADYDRTLFQRPSRGVVASPVVSYANAGGYRGSRWETDQCW